MTALALVLGVHVALLGLGWLLLRTVGGPAPQAVAAFAPAEGAES